MTAELRVTSSAFGQDETIPSSAAHSAVGGQNLSPQLAWSAGPSGTQSYVLSCWDPDAPTTVGFCHWIRFGIGADIHELGEADETVGTDGFTDWGESRYGGMAPPAGDPPHHYQFTVYALDVASPRLDPQVTYARFRFTIRDHVLAAGTLIGRFGIAEPS
jgi:Raf kinase inhibitor-like YbhB/YbcL family protein